ncbi:sterol desaturase family protein [Candidatus Kryptobacter tengchongensis]|uniref:sterol desaturase family protein n=1 Tax=Kryptobacter tengchongensis TaxID=1643429 RepID=UPI0007075897|nr:sterol desaturase family protein [Candidatus Kryptobacter tengchongensis]CUS83103.1 beta-carotene 3-hydroxylase [Candidatus Kryptobacter tengchongensis]
MMEIFLTSIVVFLLMEPIVWLIHKYVMHGFLWVLHEDHHKKYPKKGLEKNDIFVLFFALVSIALLYLGFKSGNKLILSIGIGMTIYGFAYFTMHDVLSHRRINIFKNPKNFYFLAVIRAHKQHHKNLEKDNSECFGFVYLFPIKYYKLSLKKSNAI